MQKDAESDVNIKKNTEKKDIKPTILGELLGRKEVRKAKLDIQNIFNTYSEVEKWRDRP